MTNTDNLFKVGTIVNTHGIRGEVKIMAITDFPENRFKKGVELQIETKQGLVPMTVQSSRLHKNMWLVLFEGITNINEIEKYKTDDIYVASDERQELEDDEYYYDEIIDSRVVDLTGNVIGIVSEIMTTGANDVWVVKREGQPDALIPMIDDVVKSVDVDNKLITIDALEGLLD
ncbi:ribosome maturation factor RimM [Leuconostoc carnosum]|uniref:ribosome maturation factor RimM n=1 Tax=Leuconostoc TaxID=1243 RepID=UPI000D511362|nr:MULTISPECIES: ribosome maturation factor RimM [Leuconostoc]KAA8326043.1 ribosome maturation factor RimM [Leuconostoc carnosum]KAA8362326.1 ribosome maturation factor RimM [Leuconostoc carnosum]KAA8366875.1 ribosome maturation factor RimM [Leuconostoc carnosum]KAA8367989.1 ribosome maturation factor RimM [Leuconostoc carnosum]KAA8373253.1 ribosome maturation factor RimM [Leuconostoc carnosum]